VFNAGRAVDEPVGPINPDKEVKSDQFWLVAFLGTSGSSPPEWLVGSARLKGNEVRLVYRKKSSESADAFPYLVWVPLGKLKPGIYTVELFDEDKRRVTLLRRVTIGGK
jgi:hypothetical protein